MFHGKLIESELGITYSEMAVGKHINTSEVVIDRLHDMGISIFIPKNSLSSGEEPLLLHIRPCLSGQFELPSEYSSASPAYLISFSREVKLQKNITVRILHYASLQNKEDCDNITFFSAKSTPEFRKSHPVYTFKKICGSTFRPGDQVGEITVALRQSSILGIFMKNGMYVIFCDRYNSHVMLIKNFIRMYDQNTAPRHQ